MKDKKGIFQNEIEDISTNLNDHAIDCRLIDRSEEEDTDGGAQG